MNPKDFLVKLRHANAAENVGSFKARLKPLVSPIPAGVFADASVLAEWRITARRIDKEVRRDPVNLCECGHDHAWHKNGPGTECELCTACAVFRPIESVRSAPSKRGTSRRPSPHAKVIRDFFLPLDAQMAIAEAELADEERRRRGAPPAENVWEATIRRRHEQEQATHAETQVPPDVHIDRLPPGHSAHLTRAVGRAPEDTFARVERIRERVRRVRALSRTDDTKG